MFLFVVGATLGVFGDERLLFRVRQLVVMRKLLMEPAAAFCDASKVQSITHHRGHGHLRPNPSLTWRDLVHAL
jgi:hypothetical protein